MTDEIRLPVLSVKDDTVVANSRDVAEYFGKRHADVLRSVDTLECSAGFRERNFALTEETGIFGTALRTIRSFDLTKDGFTFLAMGFTGGKAAAFKEAYIAQFNAMEAELRRPARISKPTVPDSSEMEFVRLAKQVHGERFAAALWNRMGFYCPPGFEPIEQGNLFQPANQNISILIRRAS